jgi:hypothetical protein
LETHLRPKLAAIQSARDALKSRGRYWPFDLPRLSGNETYRYVNQFGHPLSFDDHTTQPRVAIIEERDPQDAVMQNRTIEVAITEKEVFRIVYRQWAPVAIRDTVFGFKHGHLRRVWGAEGNHEVLFSESGELIHQSRDLARGSDFRAFKFGVTTFEDEALVWIAAYQGDGKIHHHIQSHIEEHGKRRLMVNAGDDGSALVLVVQEDGTIVSGRNIPKWDYSEDAAARQMPK